MNEKPKLKTVSTKLTQRDFDRLQAIASINGVTIEFVMKHLVECLLDGKRIGQF